MISDFPAIVDACVLVQAAVRDELHEQGAALNKPRTISEVLGSLQTCRCTQFAQLIRERLAL